MRCHSPWAWTKAASFATPAEEDDLRPVLRNHFGDRPFNQSGITCARCHGDTVGHVASKGQAAIINPAKLSPPTRDAVCQQCHLEGEATVRLAGKTTNDFKPGDVLTDAECFGGLREQVLERDEYACRVCGDPDPGVHHREPGNSVLHQMIALCAGCHAKVHRTKVVLTEFPPLLLVLWRDQHPQGHAQTYIDLNVRKPPA